jgi:nicotinate-nucleotide adenylyltransferase
LGVQPCGWEPHGKFDTINVGMASNGSKPYVGGRRLCFGGSFNPIHHGHLITARAAAEALGYEQVILIPSAQPPHKPSSAELAAPEDRLKMAQLAVTGEPGWHVSDIELQRKGPSYTIQTVRELKGEGWGEVDWLIGADMLAMLPQWHEAEALVEETRFVVLARPGWTFDWARLPERFRRLEAQVVRAPLIELSATEIRRRVREGRSIEYLTPPAVVKYIREKGLYRG